MRCILNLCLITAMLASCGLTGCALSGRRDGLLSASEKRARWWQENRDSAELVPGKGYRVPGRAGFFDEEGQLVSSGFVPDGDASDGALAPPVPAEPAGPVEPAGLASPTGPVEPPLLADAEAAISEQAVAVADADTPPEVTLAQHVAPLVPDPRGLFDPPPQRAAPAADVAGAAPITTAQREFSEAEALFQRQEYRAAARKFKAAAKSGEETAVEEDALFMTAECNFFANRYPDAGEAYTALIKKYPSTRHLDRASARQFAIAHYWQQHHEADPKWPFTPNLFDSTRHRFDALGHAVRTYQNIRLNDPTGPLADDAVMAQAGVYFSQGKWEEADYHYGILRKEYTDSEHVYEAFLLGLQCKLRRYQGPDYDGTPLEEAEKLADQLLKQFPDKLGDDRARIEKIRGEVVAQRGLRDWKMGEYYAGRGQVAAARDYFASVAEKFPGTEMAEQARAQIASFEGQPDEPEQKLPWLVNLFPGNESGSSLGEPAGTSAARVAELPQGSSRR